MPNCFHFPVVDPNLAGSTVSRTYASVTKSILQSIRDLGEQFADTETFVCPGNGCFDVIFRRYPSNGRRVRLRFSYPNLYLQAFKTHGVWYRFQDQHPVIVPAGAPAHRYVVEVLPFESGYTRGGLEAQFSTLTVGRSIFLDMLVTYCDYPNNQGGIRRLQEDLTRSCVVFSEALRLISCSETPLGLATEEDAEGDSTFGCSTCGDGFVVIS